MVHVLGHIGLTDEEFTLLREVLMDRVLNETDPERRDRIATLHDELLGPDLQANQLLGDLA